MARRTTRSRVLELTTPLRRFEGSVRRRKRRRQGVIFLLGAGASVDAGMPTVADLTRELKEQLQNLPDINGQRTVGFAKLFSAIEQIDADVGFNYERFFQWIDFLHKVQTDPFNKVANANVGPCILEAASQFPAVIGGEIARLLARRKSKPHYLVRLTEFLPGNGRLAVFTLNYDCCVEDACRRGRIALATGFDPGTRLWNPAVFRSGGRGINLYKLHGSLRWFQELYGTSLCELKAGDRKQLPKFVAVSDCPELILGPAPKIQPDDPYITLFFELHRAVQRARVCVVIGYGHADKHINTVLERAVAAGLAIVDVNTGPANQSLQRSGAYVHLKQTAKSALTGPAIRSALQRVLA